MNRERGVIEYKPCRNGQIDITDPARLSLWLGMGSYNVCTL